MHRLRRGQRQRRPFRAGKRHADLTNVANSYSGGTFINGGNLLVNDPTGKVLGNGANGVVLNAGQLSGTGTITQPVALNGGNIAPVPAPTLQLELAGGLQIHGGTLSFQLQNNGTTNHLDFSSGNLVASFFPTATRTMIFNPSIQSLASV